MLNKALELLKAQRGAEGSLEHGIAGILEGLCRSSGQVAELIAQDLTVKELSLTACAAKLTDYARSNEKGGIYAMSTATAMRLVCDFYKIPKEMLPAGWSIADAAPAEEPAPAPHKDDGLHVDLFDLMGDDYSEGDADAEDYDEDEEPDEEDEADGEDDEDDD